METINITRLARMFNSTTRDTEKKLSKIGLLPVNEIEMPSGRRFVVFDKEASVKALQGMKDALNPPVVMNPKKEEKEETALDMHQLSRELLEVKALLASVLEVITAPRK